MNARVSRGGGGGAWILLLAALLVAGTAWIIPARWRSVHPAVVEAAGRGTTGLLEAAVRAVRQQQPGVARWMGTAATELGIPGTQQLEGMFLPVLPGDQRLLGEPDPVLAGLFKSRTNTPGAQPVPALDAFLPASHRAALLTSLAASKSPGIQSLLRTRDLSTPQFVPASQPGGQPLDAAVLMTATLYERERLSAGLAREVRDLADRAPNDESARRGLEGFYLNLLSLARRLDWASLSQLTRSVSSVPSFEAFAGAVREHPAELPMLFSAAVLSGNAGGVARHRVTLEATGRRSLQRALIHGAGAVEWLAREQRPVLPGVWSPVSLAREVAKAPAPWTAARSALLVLAAVLGAAALREFSRVGVQDRVRLGPTLLGAALIGGFLILASEPMPPRPARPRPRPQPRLDLRALTNSSPAAISSQPRKNIMEPTTLITMVIFGAIQLAVYVICVRKIREISNLPEPPSVRLRLLENEENLFDSGLYVGIGGTATALVLQVLQLVEANLLAAYSSNLMGIICVAVVKIGHVRHARRQLILESLEPVPGTDPVAAHPLTSR